MTDTTKSASGTPGATRTPTWVWLTIGVLVVAFAVLLTLNIALLAEDDSGDVTVDLGKMNEEMKTTNELMEETNALMEQAVDDADGGGAGG